MPIADSDTLVSVEEASRILALKPSTVRALAAKGRLEQVHPAGLRSVRFRKSDVETLAGLRPAAPASSVAV